MNSNKIITIGIDSSTTNCGIAIYHSGIFVQSENLTFKGTYDLVKLQKITTTFNTIFKKHKPTLVVIEETVPVRNSRAVTTLNQVFGAIVALAQVNGAHVNQVHNKYVKKLYGFTTKEQAKQIARDLVPVTKACITEHEADAILVVEAYKELIK